MARPHAVLFGVLSPRAVFALRCVVGLCRYLRLGVLSPHAGACTQVCCRPVQVFALWCVAAMCRCLHSGVLSPRAGAYTQVCCRPAQVFALSSSAPVGRFLAVRFHGKRQRQWEGECMCKPFRADAGLESVALLKAACLCLIDVCVPYGHVCISCAPACWQGASSVLLPKCQCKQPCTGACAA